MNEKYLETFDKFPMNEIKSKNSHKCQHKYRKKAYCVSFGLHKCAGRNESDIVFYVSIATLSH